jgi:hypothetical protein
MSILKVFGGLIICGVGGVVDSQVPEGARVVLYSLFSRCCSCGIVCVAHWSHSCAVADEGGGGGATGHICMVCWER